MTCSALKPIAIAGYALGYARASVGSYFDKAKTMQIAPANAVRPNWNLVTGSYEGVLIEPERTNLLLASAELATQSRGVTAGQTYTLSFYGTGSITLSGASAGTLAGAGSYPGPRAVQVFVASSSTLTLTVSGSVLYAQLELGGDATSWIPTTSAPATRAPDLVEGTGIFHSTFPEPTPEYSATATYSQGHAVRWDTRLYESLVDANMGNLPSATSTEDADAKWLDIGPSNVCACIDNTVSVGSTGAGPLQTVSIKLPSNANAVALVGVQATKVHASVRGNAGITLAQSTSKIVSAILLSGFAPGSIVSVAVENTAGDVVLGELIVGQMFVLGGTRYGHRFSLTDYSVKKTDGFGRSKFVRRNSAKRVQCTVRVKKSNYNAVVTFLEDTLSTPTVWITSDDPDYSAGAIVYGNWADFSQVIDYSTHSVCALEIQGLI